MFSRLKCFEIMLLLLFFLLPGRPLAQDRVGDESSDIFDDFSTLNLEALLNTEVETGSGFKQKLSEVPAVVEVMTRERIESLGVRDIYELMLRLTGIRVDASSLYPFLINTPEVRGGSVNDRILLIIDDHPQLGELDEVYNGFAIPIESIERVEFLRGPAAVLYGSSSMAGVLRIVTRKGDDNGGGGSVILDPIGAGGELSAHGSYFTDRFDGMSLRTDLQLRRNEDWGIFVERDLYGARGRVNNQVQYLSHMTTLRNKKWYGRIQNHVIRGHLMGVQPALIFDPKASNLQMHGAEIDRNWNLKSWTLKVRAAGEQRRRRLNMGFFPPPNVTVFTDRTTDQTRTQFQFDGYSTEFAVTASLQKHTYSILTGIQYRLMGLYNVKFLFTNDNSRNPLFPVDDLKAMTHDANMYLQGSYWPAESLQMLVGSRLNIYKNQPKNANFLPPADQKPDAFISPMGRAAIVWHAFKQLTVKALYGRSFRLPTLLEMYTSIVGFVTPSTQLKPEKMDTVEFALDSRPVESVFWRVNGFYNRDRDTIESVNNPDPNVSGTQFNNNRDGFFNYGIESQVDWYVAAWLNVFGSIVFGEGYNYKQDAAGNRIQLYERDNPRIVANGAFSFKPLKNNRFTLTPFIYHRGRSDSAESDTRLSFTARYAPKDWLAVSIHADNIFNNEYYQPFYQGADLPPIVGRAVDTRTLRLGIHASF